MGLLGSRPIDNKYGYQDVSRRCNPEMIDIHDYQPRIVKQLSKE